MKPPEPQPTWVFIAHTVLHLADLKAGEESWWCVDRSCKPGEKAFIYRPLKGIILYLEILELLKPGDTFCNSYQMGTAQIKLLNVFDPPISSKELKASAARNEGFIRRNFQGKAFVLNSEKTPAVILALAKQSTNKTIKAPALKVDKPARRVSKV